MALCEMIKEALDLLRTQCGRVLFAMEEDVPSNPESVSVLSPGTVVTAAANDGDLL